MNNIQKYNKAFIESFAINEDALTALKYNSIPEWDSVGHMGLVSALEDIFDIMMEMDEIIDFSSYEKGKEIMQKYNIDI